MSKLLTVLYFAWIREKTALAHEEILLPDDVTTVADLMDYLSTRSAGHAQAFVNRKVIRCAVNQEFVDALFAVQPGDEVAFFPPVTGG